MKNNFKLISKGCLTPKGLRAFAVAASILTLTSAFASNPAKTSTVTAAMLEQELKAHASNHSAGFEELISGWQTRYGQEAVQPLHSIAKNKKASESDRFIALMAMTKIEGPASAPELRGFLKDPAWMVRSAAMKGLFALNDENSSSDLLGLLKDPALVIRAEAATLIGKMNPTGASEALFQAVFDPMNYRHGNFEKSRADWVPERALESIRGIRASLTPEQVQRYSLKLVPLMNVAYDHKLRAHALFTIEALQQKSLKKGAPFAERAQAWTQALTAKAPSSKKRT